MAPVAGSLTLVPVGVGTAYARPGEVQSSYLVRAGDRAVCMDLGAGALGRLRGEVPPERLTALVVSHLHPDHCADILSLRVYMSFGPGRGTRLPVLGPQDLRERLLAFAPGGDWDESFDFQALPRGGGAIDLGGGLVLRHAEVPHLEPTFALRLDLGAASVCFSADCSPNDALPELARGCDLLLCECSMGAEPVPEGVAHLDAPAAAAIATAAGAGRLLLTHCYPEFDREAALAAARAGFSGPVDWARQGEAVAVGEAGRPGEGSIVARERSA
jgi:ribonuclease BN (tRNA processing enzyme)